MARSKLPARLTLPTGRVLRLHSTRTSPSKPRSKTPRSKTPRSKKEGSGEPAHTNTALFDQVRSLLDGQVELTDEKGEIVDADELDLRDFHVLRAVLTRTGWLDEKDIEVHCTNCDVPMRVRPCATFELGPFADGELDDPELDEAFDFAVAHDGVVLRPLTVADARPLYAALARGPLAIDEKLARALGVVEVDGKVGSAAARHLDACDDEAFGRFCDVFLDAHYAPRLFAAHACPACGARNDVDAPWDRELAGEGAGPRSHASAQGFPSFDEFDAAVREVATDLVPAGIALVVEGGVPACDDGGVALLGSYVPPFEGSEQHPSREGEVTLFYRTFRAEWQDAGPYDWRAEVRETVEHELEHHEGHLRGHDPMDEDERTEIAKEVARTVGKRELARRGTRALFSDWGEFLRRTWPLWFVLLIAVIALVMFERSND